MKNPYRFLAAAAAIGVAFAATVHASDDLLARSRAAYGALKSYADTGTVMVEMQFAGGPLTVERHTFTTRFRTPRNFYLEFKKDPKASSERLAIWCDGGDFQSWWSATNVHEVYSGGRGVTAFSTAVYPTVGVASHLPPLLFPSAEMHGAVVDIKNVRSTGIEDLNGRKAHKIAGVVQAHFGAARPTTIWIDAETMLVRKIVEDKPVGSAAQVERVTTTFEPQVNPALDDSRFRFAVPKQSQVMR